MENEADRGAGVFVQVANGGTSREVLRIENSLIDRNDANTGGGVAIVSGFLGAPMFDTALITSDTTISDNKAVDGGGVYAELYGEAMTIEDTTLMLNESASGRGGGVFARLDDGASLQLIGSSVEDNDAGSGQACMPKYSLNRRCA